MQGIMGGMMGQNPPKEEFPSLMSLPELTRERREEILNQAQARMQEGTTVLSKGLDQLAQAADTGANAAMQEALVQVHEGLQRFESGLAAKRAVTEGKAPREIALQWFKREMNLSGPATGEEPGFRLWGMTPFHTFVMAVLVVFAVVMIWMYYHKMRRASELVARLTSGAPTAGAVAAGTPVVPGATAVPPPAVAPHRTVPSRPARWPA
jgi:hypothetical protein